MALPIADTTTITSLPRFLVNATLSATALMRSGSATDVPPYFWTISATGTAGYKPPAGPARCVLVNKVRSRCASCSRDARVAGSSALDDVLDDLEAHQVGALGDRLARCLAVGGLVAVGLARAVAALEVLAVHPGLEVLL